MIKSSSEKSTNKYNPVRTSSHIALCKAIQDNRAVINVENNEHCCFACSMWVICILLIKNNELLFRFVYGSDGNEELQLEVDGPLHYTSKNKS